MNFVMNVFLLDRESKFISLSLSGGKTISLCYEVIMTSHQASTLSTFTLSFKKYLTLDLNLILSRMELL